MRHPSGERPTPLPQCGGGTAAASPIRPCRPSWQGTTDNDAEEDDNDEEDDEEETQQGKTPGTVLSTRLYMFAASGARILCVLEAKAALLINNHLGPSASKPLLVGSQLLAFKQQGSADPERLMGMVEKHLIAPLFDVHLKDLLDQIAQELGLDRPPIGSSNRAQVHPDPVAVSPEGTDEMSGEQKQDVLEMLKALREPLLKALRLRVTTAVSSALMPATGLLNSSTACEQSADRVAKIVRAAHVRQEQRKSRSNVRFRSQNRWLKRMPKRQRTPPLPSC